MLQAPHRKSRVALLLLGAVLTGTACLSTGAVPEPEARPPAALAPQPGRDANTAAPPAADPNAAAGNSSTVQLSPYALQLPTPPTDASEAVRAFNVAAVRAVSRVYQNDADDPSVLLALQDQLANRAELRGLTTAWQDPITTALARTSTLQALGPTLRALRAAMANAYFDERMRIYRNVDNKACRAAFDSMPTQDETLMSFVVTVEPVGTFPLSKFRVFCDDSRSAALRERRLPGRPAPEALTRLVRRLYTQAHLGGQVRRVSLLSGWQREAQQTGYTLRAVVGVMRPEVDNDDDACSMAEVAIVRTASARAGEFPIISEVGEREAILCNQLR